VQPACSCLFVLPLPPPSPSALPPQPAAAPVVPACGPRAPRWPTRRATGAAATHHPSDSVAGTTPIRLRGRGGTSGTTIISRGADGLATSSRGLHVVMSTRARDHSSAHPIHTVKGRTCVHVCTCCRVLRLEEECC